MQSFQSIVSIVHNNFGLINSITYIKSMNVIFYLSHSKTTLQSGVFWREINQKFK